MFWNKKKSAETAAAKAQTEELSRICEQVYELLKAGHALTDKQRDELKAVMAAAGIAGSSLKVAETLKSADDFGDRMHRQTMKMIEEANTITQSLKAKSALDVEALRKSLERLEAEIKGQPAGSAAAVTPAEPPVTARPITVGRPLKLKPRKP